MVAWTNEQIRTRLNAGFEKQSAQDLVYYLMEKGDQPRSAEGVRRMRGDSLNAIVAGRYVLFSTQALTNTTNWRGQWADTHSSFSNICRASSKAASSWKSVQWNGECRYLKYQNPCRIFPPQYRDSRSTASLSSASNSWIQEDRQERSHNSWGFLSPVHNYLQPSLFHSPKQVKFLLMLLCTTTFIRFSRWRLLRTSQRVHSWKMDHTT